MGRPKGSKNKKTLEKEKQLNEANLAVVQAITTNTKPETPAETK